MIGIFDSGVGGFCAYRRVRELLPGEEILYLADTKNAPYGTKTEDEIKRLTEKNIKILRSAGADEILIACCSASSIHHLLSEEDRAASTPIILPASEQAARVGRKIAVIATRHTASSHAFGKAIAELCDTSVTEMAEQELVSLVESGNRDGRIDRNCRRYLRAMAQRIKETEADCLILGCTHFSHLKGEIGRLLPKLKIISPADVGAEVIVNKRIMLNAECRMQNAELDFPQREA